MAPLVRAVPLSVFHGCADTVREDSISDFYLAQGARTLVV